MMTSEEFADLLEISGRAFTSTLDSVPAEAAQWHPKPDEWCVNECVGHVVEAETRGFAGRIKIILGADEPKLETWDQVAVQNQRNDCDRQPSELRDELARVRKESVKMVRALRPENMSRGGMHPKAGRLTVDEILRDWVHHDGNHLKQAMNNVQEYVQKRMPTTG
jgi:hypothetical protein